MLKYTDFYNHKKFLSDVKEGHDIIQNTDFVTPMKERINASKQFKVGQVVPSSLTRYCYDVLIQEIHEDGNLSIHFLTKTGKLKRSGARFANPIHLLEDIERFLADE